VFDGLTGSGWLPPDAAQALRNADAAAIEKLRRDRRGDEGFNKFLLLRRAGRDARRTTRWRLARATS
jgi:hypothetical protein